MKFFYLAFLAITLVACASGNCRSVSDAKKASLEATAGAPLESKVPDVSTAKTRVIVYKYDGSLQCGMGKPMALETMRKELKEIRVFRSENKSDNLMHVQACGTPTGRANIYEIDNSELEQAKKYGFQEWTFD